LHSELSETTQLLRAMAAGDPHALEELTPRVYRELRRLAGNLMRSERPGRTLQATALVHEAYLKLVDVKNVDWEHRAHFFAVAAQVMRRILLDAARRRSTAKRGGGADLVNLDDVAELGTVRGKEIVALDEALDRLARDEPRKAKVVELRFFGGLTEEEISKVLGVSADTVTRDWRFARAWLRSQMES
jgi:RNA polymerase sigma factor (TIGR02999 family)